MHVNEKEVDSIGLTNGAMMRTALLGLIFQDDSVRDAWVRSLSSTTHRSYAVESSVALARAFTEGKLEINDSWERNNQGVSNDATVTLHALGHVLSQAVTPLDAMQVSCSLGGDTDTVAALSASLIASLPGNYERVFEIPWLQQVDWNGIQGFTAALEVVFARMEKR
jgi:ADP-ribosylglycohydrolase